MLPLLAVHRKSADIAERFLGRLQVRRRADVEPLPVVAQAPEAIGRLRAIVE